MHIVKASLFNILGRVVSIVSTFVSIFLLGRMFSATEFGYWTWLFSIFSLITAQDFGVIAAMRVRLGQAVVSGSLFKQQLYYSAALVVSVLISGSVFLCWLFLGDSGFTDQGGGVLISVVLGCGLLTVIGYCSAQGSVAYLQSGWVGIAESMRGLLQVLAILVSQVLEYDLIWAVCLFYGVSMLYTPFIMAVFLRARQWRVSAVALWVFRHVRVMLAAANTLLKEGFFLWLMQISLAFLALSDVFIAGFLVSNNEVALVNAIARLVLVAVGFVMAAMTPFTGHFVARLKSLNKVNVWYQVQVACWFLIAAGVLYAVFLYAFGSLVIRYWANLTIEPSFVFVIAGLLFGVMSIVVLLQIFLQMPVFSKAVLPWLAAMACLKIALAIVLTPLLGYEGIFVASLIANLGFVLSAGYLLFHGGYFEKISNFSQSDVAV